MTYHHRHVWPIVRKSVRKTYRRPLRVLEQVAWQSLHKAIAMHCRSIKERDGEPFDPARIAIVAYHVADTVGQADPVKYDVNQADEVRT